MNPYRHKISLRFRGGVFEPDNVSKVLSLSPWKSWRAASLSETPSRGMRRNSYWTHRFEPADEAELEDSISGILRLLLPYHDFLKGMRARGIQIELFIGIFGSKNFGFNITHALSRRVAEAGLDLVFDVYPEEEIGSTAQAGEGQPAPRCES